MIDWKSHPLPTLLFAPGSEPRKLKRLPTFGASAIVLDLEDAVAEDRKTEARSITAEAISGYGPGDAAVLARVNGESTGRMLDDIEAVVVPGVDAIVIPKVESLDLLAFVSDAIAAGERRHRMPADSVGVFALIETAAGLSRCEQLLDGAPRLITAILGLGDLVTDLGIDLSTDRVEVQYARSRLVVASRAAGLIKPIDGPYLELQDEAGLVADCERSRRLGFQGRVIVYPPQVAPATMVYGLLAPQEAERLQRLVDAFEEAERAGIASIRHDEQFVDYPIYFRAKELLMRHVQLSASGASDES
jgi:citrate lyase subunit beta/citryl-CoA lyase